MRFWKGAVMIRYSLTFLSGALIPAIALYLTGGSNRFNFIFGLILGALLTIAALFSIRGRSHNPNHSPKPQPTQLAVRLMGTSAMASYGTPVAMQMYQDASSALTNLGVPHPKAQRTVKDLMATKQYPNDERGMKDLLGDAVRAATAMNRRTA